MLKLITSSVILGAFFGFAAVQQAPEPYPGQSRHEKPPDGWTCSRDAEDRTHLCFCAGMKRNDDPMCKKEEPREDDPATDDVDESQPQPIPEDPKCLVWCHASACTCKQFCDT